MIRAEAPEGDEAAQRAAVEQIKGALDARLGGGLSYQRAEFVGPKVSEELLINSIWAVLVSLLGVLLYLWFRFEWQYGIGAIAVPGPRRLGDDRHLRAERDSSST